VVIVTVNFGIGISSKMGVIQENSVAHFGLAEDRRTCELSVKQFLFLLGTLVFVVLELFYVLW
jgi:hypothetical protein